MDRTGLGLACVLRLFACYALAEALCTLRLLQFTFKQSAFLPFYTFAESAYLMDGGVFGKNTKYINLAILNNLLTP
jgi:hypothetical protein